MSSLVEEETRYTSTKSPNSRFEASALNQSVRQTDKFNTYVDYLNNITTDLDLMTDVRIQTIYKAIGNEYMSVMILELQSATLQTLYGGPFVIRCYKDKVKFFEMPLKNKPIFLDLYESTVGWIYENEEKTFHVIDVLGRPIDSDQGREEEVLPMENSREIEFDFDEKIIGFKLAHFNQRKAGHMKAVFWSETEIYRHAFNPRFTNAQETKEKSLKAHRDKIGLGSISVKRIFGLGVNSAEFAEYDEDYPELLLLIDDSTPPVIHILKGTAYGSEFEEYIKYESDYKEVEAEKIIDIHELRIVGTSKVIGVIEKVLDGETIQQTFTQVFEFDPKNADSLVMTREFAVMESKRDEAMESLRDFFVEDYNSEQVYFKDFNEKDEIMIQVPISNNYIGKADLIKMNHQVAMNITANNTKELKTRGLIYTDYLAAGTFVVLIHGRMITCFNIVDKKQKVEHLCLEVEEKEELGFYNQENEPCAIWMMDKSVNDTKQRWKIIIAFKNGEVKELSHAEQDKVTLNKYLVGLGKKNPAAKLPGKIVKVLRNRNSNNQPVFFVIQKEVTTEEENEDGDKVKVTKQVKVFATIEFISQTYREFEIKGVVPEDTTYVILDNKDPKLLWQEVACFVTTKESEESIIQKLIHVKVRIGQFRDNKNPEVIPLNKELLQPTMANIKLSTDIFVCDNFIYFVHKKSTDIQAHVDQYNLADNSHTQVSITEGVAKLKVFNNEFFYWRTVLGGFNDNKFQSNIYFDGIRTFSEFNKSHTQDIRIFQGIYPHINKLQYDIMTDSIACFTDFYKIKIFPLLHQTKIKVKVAGDRDSDDHIIATKFYEPNYLVTADQSGYLKVWNMKTGKYLVQEKQFKSLDAKKYIWHQRINDRLTMIREKAPMYTDVLDSRTAFMPKYDWTDQQNDIFMYRYKIIEITYDSQGPLDVDGLDIKVIETFVGPGVKDEYDYGLYAGDDLDLYVFFYKDSQEKMQLHYARIKRDSPEIADEPGFLYMAKENRKAQAEDAKLSIHSPNFKRLIKGSGAGSRDYSIVHYASEYDLVKLPPNLNIHTIDSPNFIKNNMLLFMTEDKIIKGFKFEEDQQKNAFEGSSNNQNVSVNATGEAKGREEFLVTHCHFPGSTDEINLATLITIGNENNLHLIGENCLTYYQIKSPEEFDPKTKEITPEETKEYIGSNNFNSFFLDAAQQYVGNADYNEMKIIACHYKSKIELDQRSIFGYYLTQKSVLGKICTQLYVTTSFTFYHWRILSLIETGKMTAFNLSAKTVQDLSYSQLANGDTLLHLLYKNKAALEYIYTVAQAGNEDGCEFYIPLLKDRKDKTALDYALNKQDKEGEPQLPKKELFEQKASENVVQTEGGEQPGAMYRKSAELILKNIANYPFGLFKVELKDLIATMITEQLTEFAIFIESSAKTPSFLKGIDRAKISYEDTCGAFVFDANEVWSQNPSTDFKYEDPKGEDKIVQLKIVDIPMLHHYTSGEDNEIFQALSESEDQSIFDIVTIKALIEQKWPLAKDHVMRLLLLPYLVFLLVFTFYTLNDLETSFADQQSESLVILAEEPYIFIVAVTCRVVILLFTGYFFAIEVYQCSKDTLTKHMSDFWNYLDIIPPLFIFSAEIMNIANGDHRVIRTLYAVTSLAMWLRFLYFFRIYKATNFYIRMIYEVCKDMGQFFFILFITMFAFAHTYYIMFMNHNVVDAQLVYGSDGVEYYELVQTSSSEFTSFVRALLQSYMNGFGQFECGNFGLFEELMVQTFFILNTLFIIIVMLNLLISIVGATFGRVLDNKDRMMYQDMVDLIVENQFLINPKQQATLNSGKYLVLVVPEDNIQDQQEQMLANFNEIKDQIQTVRKENVEREKQVSYSLDRILKAQKLLQDRVEELAGIPSKL